MSSLHSTFTRDPRHSLEKAQALKLLRWVINLGVLSPSTSTAPGTVAGGPPKIPLCDGIVRTLVSVAENGDDSFRLICLETLAEIGELHLFDMRILRAHRHDTSSDPGCLGPPPQQRSTRSPPDVFGRPARARSSNNTCTPSHRRPSGNASRTTTRHGSGGAAALGTRWLTAAER